MANKQFVAPSKLGQKAVVVFYGRFKSTLSDDKYLYSFIDENENGYSCSSTIKQDLIQDEVYELDAVEGKFNNKTGLKGQCKAIYRQPDLSKLLLQIKNKK